MYLVTVLEKRLKATFAGVFEQSLDMSWHDGQIGVMPVFEDYESAKAAVEKGGLPLSVIVELHDPED